MSEALYERYKDALRRGHVAAMRGRHADALEAYSEAARIAPDRALPLTGLAAVLVRLGKPQEALATYDRALERAPGDETALRGRADLLLGSGDPAGAAETLDRLAGVLDAAGRLPDAADAARRALELAESRGRRAAMRALVARLRGSAADPAAVEALARASAVLEEGGPTGRSPRRATTASDGAGQDDAALEAEADDASEAGSDPEPEPERPPFDPGQAIGAVEEAALGDDPARTRELALAAAEGHRAAGQPSSAIEACYMALAGSPADPGLHVALAELYLDQGWRALAGDKLVLLHRLADLSDDGATLERVRTVATARLADDPRVAELVAGPTV